MTKSSRATETTLGRLHAKVAEVLIEAMEGDVIPGYTDVDPDSGEETVVEDRRLPPSAALIGVATKFLKDNEITAVADEGSALDKLREKFEKRGQNRVSPMDRMDAADKASFLQGLN